MCSPSIAQTTRRRCRRLILLHFSVILLTEAKQFAAARNIPLRGSQDSMTSLTERVVHKCDCSPYSLVSLPSFVQSGDDGGKDCFLVGFRGCNPNSTCCETLLRGGVDGLYLLTGASWLLNQHAIRQVEVNSSRWPHWDAAPHSADFPGIGPSRPGGIRIFGLAAISTSLPGTTICITKSQEPGSEAGQQLRLCDSQGPCRFTVASMSSGSNSGVDSNAVCPVLGPHRRSKLLAVSAAAGRPPSPPPNIRPSPSPRPPPRVPTAKPPPRLRVQSPPRSKPPPTTPQPPSPPPPMMPSSPMTPSISPPSSPLSTSPPPSSPFGYTASTNSSSRVCGAIVLLSPQDESGALTYTFGKQVSCDGTADWMAKNLTQAALQAGAQVSVPFGLDSCSVNYEPNTSPPVLPQVVVCGSFATVGEAAKIQGLLESILSQWRLLVLGWELPHGGPVLYMCPPPGYRIQSMVWGEEEGSPLGFMDVRCSSSRDWVGS